MMTKIRIKRLPGQSPSTEGHGRTSVDFMAQGGEKPKKSTLNKVKDTAKGTAGAAAVNAILNRIPGADTIYDAYNVLSSFSDGDFTGMAANTIGALIPGLSGKVIEEASSEFAPETSSIDRAKFRFNSNTSNSERMKYLRKYGQGYLDNPDFQKEVGLEQYEQGGSVRRTLAPVRRDDANIEAEKGEVIAGNFAGDDTMYTMNVGGKKHSQGGTPLQVPDESFVFSDSKDMTISGEVLQKFGKTSKNKKRYTPAQLAKQYDVSKYQKVLDDPTSDPAKRRTAELMIANYKDKLATLAMIQEEKKGFPQGIPSIAMPEMPEMEQGGYVNPFDQELDSFARGGEKGPRIVNASEVQLRNPKVIDEYRRKQLDAWDNAVGNKYLLNLQNHELDTVFIKKLKENLGITPKQAPKKQPTTKNFDYLPGSFAPLDKGVVRSDTTTAAKPSTPFEYLPGSFAPLDNEVIRTDANRQPSTPAVDYDDYPRGNPAPKGGVNYDDYPRGNPAPRGSAAKASATRKATGSSARKATPSAPVVTAAPAVKPQALPGFDFAGDLSNVLSLDELRKAYPRIQEVMDQAAPDQAQGETKESTTERTSEDMTGYMTPDIWAMREALSKRMNIDKTLPFYATPDVFMPDAHFADPSRELAANSEQAFIQTMANNEFSGAQARRANASSIQGQAVGQAAQTIGRYNEINAQIAGQHSLAEAQLMSQHAGATAEVANQLYQGNAVADQQYKNAKEQADTNFTNTRINAWDNRSQLSMTNAINHYFDKDPVTGDIVFRKGKSRADVTGGGGNQPAQKDYDAIVKFWKGKGVKEEEAHRRAYSEMNQTVRETDSNNDQYPEKRTVTRKQTVG